MRQSILMPLDTFKRAQLIISFHFSAKTYVVGTQRTVSMIRSFEHPNHVTISTKTYAVDTQKYRLDETVLLSTQKQMLKIDFLFA